MVTEKDCISSNYSCLIINQEMQTTTEALGLVKEGRRKKVVSGKALASRKSW